MTVNTHVVTQTRVTNKNKERLKIQSDVENYLNNGGKIRKFNIRLNSNVKSLVQEQQERLARLKKGSLE